MSEDKYQDNEIISIKERKAIQDQQALERLEHIRRERAKTSAKRKQAQKRRRTAIYLLVVAFLVGAVVYAAVSIFNLEKEKKELESQQQELKQQLEELKEEVKNSDDPEYVEKNAREKLNMVYPDETLYVIDEEDD